MNQGLEINLLYFFVFLVIVFVGMFVVTSLLIGSFEESYESHQHEFEEQAHRGRMQGLALSFCIWNLSTGSHTMTDASFVEFVSRVQDHERAALHLAEVAILCMIA